MARIRTTALLLPMLLAAAPALRAQLVAPEDVTAALPLLDAPAKLRGTPGDILVYYDYDCGCQALGYATRTDSGHVLRQVLKTDVMYNDAKAPSEARFSADTLLVWSEMPFKATTIAYAIVVKGDTLKVVAERYDDPNDAVLEEMEDAFESGDVQRAIDAYQGLQYASSYVSYQEIGDRCLEIAYPRARNAFADGYPREAVEEMQPWVETFGFGVLEDYLGERNTRKMELRERTAQQALVDYVGYLLAKGDTAATSEGCKKLIGYELGIPEPHRLMGDLYFEAGRYADAKLEYLNYQRLMKRAGRSREIPPQVKKRSKYKTS